MARGQCTWGSLSRHEPSLHWTFSPDRLSPLQFQNQVLEVPLLWVKQSGCAQNESSKPLDSRCHPSAGWLHQKRKTAFCCARLIAVNPHSFLSICPGEATPSQALPCSFTLPRQIPHKIALLNLLPRLAFGKTFAAPTDASPAHTAANTGFHHQILQKPANHN